MGRETAQDILVLEAELHGGVNAIASLPPSWLSETSLPHMIQTGPLGQERGDAQCFNVVKMHGFLQLSGNKVNVRNLGSLPLSCLMLNISPIERVMTLSSPAFVLG